MITNDRQRRITAAKIRSFEQAAQRAKDSRPSDEVDPRLHEAMIAGIESQLDDLRTELNEYEALRQGRIKSRELESLGELPDALIEGRIARGWTQKQLGDKLGTSEQQIQRYEQTRYSGASLERLMHVAEAVQLTMWNKVAYPVAAKAARSTAAKTKTRARTKARSARRTKRKATPPAGLGDA